jgi:hypothetical protein
MHTMSAQQLTFSDLLTIKPAPTQQKRVGNPKLAARLRKMADRLTSQIEDKRRPLTQNPTPKRMRDYASRVHDGNNLERTQKALYALADLHERGQVPSELEGIKTKKDIHWLVCTGHNSQGYYDYSDSHEFVDKSPAGLALQALISGTTAQQEEHKRQAEIERLEAQARLNVGKGGIPGFFPTPRHIARQMVQLAHIEPSMSVLEPSAGSGAIADVIREECPMANIGVIEWNNSLRELLKLKGYDVIGDDFLEHWTTNNGIDGWHRIVMNPPFEKQQDIDHIRHAFDRLKAGGILVSIVSESVFFRDNKKSIEFRDWLDDCGYGCADLEAGAFAESGTNVKTRIIVLAK